jgi:hypothetical protein
MSALLGRRLRNARPDSLALLVGGEDFLDVATEHAGDRDFRHVTRLAQPVLEVVNGSGR